MGNQGLGKKRLTELDLVAVAVLLGDSGSARVGVEEPKAHVAPVALCSIVVICRLARC